MTNQTFENLKETSDTGLKGIFKITSFKHVLFSFKVSWLSLCIAFILTILTIILKVNTYNLINEITKLTINFLPSIIGFTIAGYSLVVAFIPQNDMLFRITERITDKKFSHFQYLSSIFALNVIFQGFSLIVAFLFHFVMYFDMNTKIKMNLPYWYIEFINISGVFIISYFFILSLFLVIQIVINIFNFSQTHHFFIVKDKLDNNK